MSFRLTYAEILRMVRNVVLNTSVARDIVRRAGIRFGDAGVTDSGDSAGGPLVARFGYRALDQPPPLDILDVTYGEQTIVPFYSDQILPVGTTPLLMSTIPGAETGVQIVESGYYRVQAKMWVQIEEMDIPWVIQTFVCTRNSAMEIQRQVLLNEQFFPSEPAVDILRDDWESYPADEQFLWSTSWFFLNPDPYLSGQNIIYAAADEILTIDLLISFLGDYTTTAGDPTGGVTQIYSDYAERQWIELLNPSTTA